MTPQERALHETQVSLERQKRQLELRYQAETEKLHMAAEEDPLSQPFRRKLELEELLPPLLHRSPF